MSTKSNRKPVEPEPDPTPPLDRYLAKPAVANLLGIGVSTLDRLVATGQFPRPIKVGSVVRWRAGLVQEHLEGLEAAARGGT